MHVPCGGSKGVRLRGVGSLEGFAFVVRSGENRVGAGCENEVAIHHPGVSRKHAILRLVGGVCELEDLRSKNGTTINGRKVQRAPLRVGDTVMFGPACFCVEGVSSSDARMAICLPSGAADRPVRARRSEHRTSTWNEQPDVPQRWLGVLGRVAELAMTPGTSGVVGALSVLQDGLDASAVALLQWSLQSDVVVSHVCGDFVIPAGLHQLRRCLDDDLRRLEGRFAFKKLVDRERPSGVLAGACLPDGSVRALVCTGDLTRAEASKPLLEASLKVILRATTFEPRSSLQEPRRPIAELQLPASHLPGKSAAMA
ncbi:MAG: FHA domain-containing protein, partial [Acidobacteriota bacterium]